MRGLQTLGLLGGTFDPVHCGHLRLAVEMREVLGLDEVRLIPLDTPPHRDAPQAPAGLRRRMLEAAVAGLPGLRVDDRELRRAGVSYTVDTLVDLRRELPDASLCLIVGMDAFASLHTWHRWRELVELAHIAVAHRPGASPPAAGPVAELLAEQRCEDAGELVRAPAGRIVLCPIPALEVSSTRLRESVAAGRSLACLVPEPVIEIIMKERIYAN